jgi:hypothetical protein
VAISEQHGFSFSGDSARIILGWARAQLGNRREGVTADLKDAKTLLDELN